MPRYMAALDCAIKIRLRQKRTFNSKLGDLANLRRFYEAIPAGQVTVSDCVPPAKSHESVVRSSLPRGGFEENSA